MECPELLKKIALCGSGRELRQGCSAGSIPLVPLSGYVEQGLSSVDFTNVVVYIIFNAEVCNALCGCLENNH